MANYKKITDVDVLAEASETTNVLVEENGSLKKVPAAAMGGGNGNFVFIDRHDPDADDDTAYTCSVTYDELVNMFNNKEISGTVVRELYNSNGNQYFYNVTSIILSTNGVFGIRYMDNSESRILFYFSDGTISTSAPGGAQ